MSGRIVYPPFREEGMKMVYENKRKIKIFDTYLFVFFLLLFHVLFPYGAESALHPFAKSEKAKVEPNVLLLIDTSASMVFRMDNNDSRWGDGTKPVINGANKYIYYGKDNNPGKNIVDNNYAGEDKTYYHPNLRFIPLKELQDVGISSQQADKYFSLRDEDKGDPKAKVGESNYKYPNDSRMYTLKNVMYRILQDRTLISNMRLALATYHQSKISNWTLPNNRYIWYIWPPEGTNTDTGDGVSFYIDANFNDRQPIYWQTASLNRARLVEGFDNTDNTFHFDRVLQWFDGKDVGDGRELRADGGTPLALSIYNDNSESVRHYFSGNDAEGDRVISESCQSNWLIVLTDGADSTGNDPAESVRKLYNLYKSPSYRPIKTFVIGLVKPAQNNLTKTLSKMADYGDDGTLRSSTYYNNSWKWETDKDVTKAYFPQNMEELFDAFREIFYSIKEQASTGGAPLATPSKSPSGEDSYYQAQFLPRNGKQWEGYLAKYVRAVADDGTVTYTQKWEAADRLSKTTYTQRNIYTAYNGLTGSSTNLVSFYISENFLSAASSITGISNTTDLANFIEWTRGRDIYDENKDGKTTDERHKLFDIYHSGIVKVDPPAASRTDALYRQFLTDHQNRQTVIYAQSNAGMVHGFNDVTVGSNIAGDERFAFIPPNVLGGNRLRGLRWADGASSYSDGKVSYPRYLADGPLIAEDVLIGTGDNRQYRTVLMGLLGLGGAGLYALDVTSPDAPNLLWAVENSIYKWGSSKKVELIGENDSNVLYWKANGSTLSYSAHPHKPAQDESFDEKFDYRNLRLTVSTPFIGKLSTGAFAFVVGNGSAGPVNENPAGEVFIGNIENGEIIKKFTTSTNSPIVSPVGVLYEGVLGNIGSFFAGDVSGKIFRFDVSDTDKSKWAHYTVFDLKSNVGISYSLDATRLLGRLWLFAGTGDLEGYLGSESANHFFIAADIAGITSASTPLGVSSLEKLDPDDAEDSLPSDTTKSGWYIPFKTSEKMSTPPLVYNGYVFFATFTPDKDVCSDSGTSRLYSMKAGVGFGGWEDETAKYIELKDIKISGISVAKGELVLGVTNYGSASPEGFRSVGDNILITKAPGGSGGGDDSGVMKTLYWKSR
jgi:type IV pilus assembly protein PilY1